METADILKTILRDQFDIDDAEQLKFAVVKCGIDIGLFVTEVDAVERNSGRGRKRNALGLRA